MSVDSHYDKVLTAVPRLNLVALPSVRHILSASMRFVGDVAQATVRFALLVLLAVMIILSLAASFFVGSFSGKDDRRRRRQPRSLRADHRARQHQRRRRRRRRELELLGPADAGRDHRPAQAQGQWPDDGQIRRVENGAC